MIQVDESSRVVYADLYGEPQWWAELYELILKGNMKAICTYVHEGLNDAYSEGSAASGEWYERNYTDAR